MVALDVVISESAGDIRRWELEELKDYNEFVELDETDKALDSILNRKRGEKDRQKALKLLRSMSLGDIRKFSKGLEGRSNLIGDVNEIWRHKSYLKWSVVEPLKKLVSWSAMIGVSACVIYFGKWVFTDNEEPLPGRKLKPHPPIKYVEYQCDGKTFPEISHLMTGSAAYAKHIQQFNNKYNNRFSYKGNKCRGFAYVPRNMVKKELLNPRYPKKKNQRYK